MLYVFFVTTNQGRFLENVNYFFCDFSKFMITDLIVSMFFLMDGLL